MHGLCVWHNSNNNLKIRQGKSMRYSIIRHNQSLTWRQLHVSPRRLCDDDDEIEFDFTQFCCVLLCNLSSDIIELSIGVQRREIEIEMMNFSE